MNFARMCSPPPSAMHTLTCLCPSPPNKTYARTSWDRKKGTKQSQEMGAVYTASRTTSSFSDMSLLLTTSMTPPSTVEAMLQCSVWGGSRWVGKSGFTCLWGGKGILMNTQGGK
jgi:hypothetical protein